MSHDDDGPGIIILSVEIPPEAAECLDNFIGIKGGTREEVAAFYVCVSHGIVPLHNREKTDLPEQAAEAAHEAAGGEGGDPAEDSGANDPE